MSQEYRKIEVVPYDARWADQYEKIAKEIQETLGSNCVQTHHIGSTSIKGLSAKPKLDVIAVVLNLTDLVEPLESIGFEYRGEWNIPLHYGFRKKEPFSVNLHVYKKGDSGIELHLIFRDYLRSHPEICGEYTALKEKLLKEKTSYEKNDSIFTGYSLGKNSFITRVLKAADFKGIRFVFCVHLEEWAAAKHFRQKYFFDKVPIKDPYEWTFYHKDHVHFILYQGVDIVGYAHVQLWPDERAAMRIIVIEEKKRNQGLGAKFLGLIETWLQLKHYKSLHVEASPNAVRFYKSQGYVEMLFHDPDAYETDERDTPLGKLLSTF